MSVYRVPVTLTTTTVSQYGNGTYRFSRSWTARTTTNTAVKIQAVFTRPTPSFMLIQSAKLSPTVVHRTLITQNQMVTSGTLLSMSRPLRVRASVVVVIRGGLRRESARNLTTWLHGRPGASPGRDRGRPRSRGPPHRPRRRCAGPLGAPARTRRRRSHPLQIFGRPPRDQIRGRRPGHRPRLPHPGC